MQKFFKNKKKNIKILTVVGARPQFIKSSIVSNEIKKKHNLLKEVLVHTGQHYDFNMNKVFFKELNIKKPDYFLNISKLNHSEMISKMIVSIDKVIEKEKAHIQALEKKLSLPNFKEKAPKDLVLATQQKLEAKVQELNLLEKKILKL